ncbi:fumarylacetoacetate hydrolase family protein [Pokkaliibacter plantistimulans]|uniref:Fumarylacetoacetate hydrolase family protein n=1 Tax=Proteobacteria bacterium 228 TaxID=2083153 RepID=A0A2S5KTE6_9PROT|nr:fumarylacetoacetate hydrolase family protein [Pokkaliibacter plantistimulans]PPC78018.1 fumarylacetoacetate hydrolase family protein [Pokkaliibacter plantistimulans]
MAYAHRYVDGETLIHPLGKVVCIGRNYAEHVRELNNAMPTEPLLFIKPATAVVPMEEPFALPSHLSSDIHYETELAILIGATLKQADEAEAKAAIAGFGLALDLTLRDVQSKLKDKGQPWEKAKAFDGSCPLSRFVRADAVSDIQNLGLKLTINNEVRQDGTTADMINPVLSLLAYISQYFTLQPGDVVLTGTPEGVGQLHSGDQLVVTLDSLLQVETRVR